jgi:XrtN system VIT domain protein
MTISRHEGTITGKAPDHLQRLFSYNDIMRKTGSRYFAQDYITDELIGEAEKSFVVSPVSSLIVLETQDDYERFGIENNMNSLKNASMKSSGAVPEPHEWMLIIFAAGSMLYLVYRSGKQTPQASA